MLWPGERVRTTLLASALILLGACGAPKGAEVVDAAPWRTEEGKQQTRLAMASDLLDIGQAGDALTLVRLAEEDGYDDPRIPLLRGRALYQQKLLTEAEQQLLVAVKEMPKDPRPHRFLGLVYADSSKPEQAIASFQRATELDHTDAATWNNLGFLLYSAGRDEEAVHALQSAVTLNNTAPRYQRNLGFALFQAGRTDEALAAFRAADPPATAVYNLGVAVELSGDPEAARARYREALRLDPDHDQASEALARLTVESPPEESP